MAFYSLLQASVSAHHPFKNKITHHLVHFHVLLLPLPVIASGGLLHVCLSHKEADTQVGPDLH